MEGLGEFSLEILRWDTNKKFKNKHLAGRAVVWTGEKDVEVMSTVMKPQQWTPPGSIFSPREAVLSSFPGGSVVKNPPAAAGFDPWPEKIPHATEHLSPCATATESVLWVPGATTPSPHATATAAVFSLHQEKPQPREARTRPKRAVPSCHSQRNALEWPGKLSPGVDMNNNNTEGSALKSECLRSSLSPFQCLYVTWWWAHTCLWT